MTDKRNGKMTKYNKALIEQRADPYVYRHTDGSYYFLASVPEYDRIIIRKADSLAGLRDAEEKTVWKKHEKGDMSQHIWAPELHYLDGKWYIYFAASKKDDIWKLRPWILECKGDDPINDEWEEKGKIQRSDDDIYSFKAFSLDATIFENKGRTYFVWAEKVSVGIQISNIYIAEMESPEKLKTAQILLTTPDYSWERTGIWVNEGPAVLKHNGRIFITYSASSTGAEYCMGMLSISDEEDILDPGNWKKEKRPILCSNEEMGFYGPGHNSFTTLDDGTDVAVFHARTYGEIKGNPLYDPNRHAFAMKIEWKDDLPVFDYKNCIVV